MSSACLPHGATRDLAGAAGRRQARSPANPPATLSCAVERALDDVRDAGERYGAGQEAGDRDLVRRVEHGRRGAARAPGGDAEPNAGTMASTASNVRARRNGSNGRAPAVVGDPPRGCVSAYRIGSSMVGNPSCASTEPSTNSTMEWMIDCGCTTTSMSSYVDVEQEVRLDHLERLVGERRGIDGDLRAHVPRRMAQRLRRRRVSSIQRPVAERPARRGQDHAAQRAFRRAADALQDGAVLAVHRHQLAAAARSASRTSGPPPRAIPCSPAPAACRPQRRQRGLEAGRADHRVDHDVGVGVRRRLEQRGAAGPDPRMQRTVGRAASSSTSTASAGACARSAASPRCCGSRPARRRGTRRVPLQHSTRSADGAGRAEQCDADHPHPAAPAQQPVVTGIVKNSESKRSSTPP
jgi:hypothetical protein